MKKVDMRFSFLVPVVTLGTLLGFGTKGYAKILLCSETNAEYMMYLV